jgi:hypothetical protein
VKITRVFRERENPWEELWKRIKREKIADEERREG